MRQKKFEGGDEKVVSCLDHIVNVESTQAQRRTLELSQQWPSKPTLTGPVLLRVVERLPVKIGICSA